MWEGGHRGPLIAACPKIIPAGTKSDALVSSVDLFATLAEMNQAEVLQGTAEGCFSYWPVLTGEYQSGGYSGRTALVYHSDSGKLAICKGDWVLLDCKGSGEWALWEQDAGQRVMVQLYNLKTDPEQQNNVASLYPEKVKQMKTELDAIRE